jgi:hypothetical protein
MVQLLKLDGIEAEGEARAQRKAEVQFLTLMTAIFFSHVQSECLGLELFFMNEYSQDIFPRKHPFAEMQGKTTYIRPKVVGTFLGPCASRNYAHQATLLLKIFFVCVQDMT